MEREDSAGLTPEEGRRFGVTVGGAFLLLGGLFMWRGHGLLSYGAFGVGAALALAAILVPARLAPVHAAWMGLARALSKVTTPIVLGIVYYVVLTPTGVLRRLLGGNPLERTEDDGSFWVDREEEDARTDMRRQF